MKGMSHLKEPTYKQVPEATDDQLSPKEITLNILFNDQVITNRTKLTYMQGTLHFITGDHSLGTHHFQ